MPSHYAILAEDETDIRLFPPLRSGWTKKGGSAYVPITGRNAKRVIFGAINIRTGYRLWLVRDKQLKEDFRAFLDHVRYLYRRWPVLLLVDEHSSHRYDTVDYARSLDIRLEFLPFRSPHLNPMDHLWRHGKENISSNRQYETIDEHVVRFVDYLDNLSNKDALRKAGVLSKNFWLQDGASK